MFNIVAIISKYALKMHIELIVKLSVKIRTGKDELKKGLERGSGQIPTNRFLGIQGILIPSTPHVYPRVPMRPRSPNTLGPGIQIMVIAPAF